MELNRVAVNISNPRAVYVHRLLDVTRTNPTSVLRVMGLKPNAISCLTRIHKSLLAFMLI